jgi:hypothetical protein
MLFPHFLVGPPDLVSSRLSTTVLNASANSSLARYMFLELILSDLLDLGTCDEWFNLSFFPRKFSISLYFFLIYDYSPQVHVLIYTHSVFLLQDERLVLEPAQYKGEIVALRVQITGI